MARRNKKVLTPEELISEQKLAEEIAAKITAGEADTGSMETGKPAAPEAEAPDETPEMSTGERSETIKYILKLGCILGALALCISLILAVANELTKDKIQQIKDDKLQIALQTVMPDGEAFDKVSFDANLYSTVSTVYEAKGADGAVCGYVVNVLPSGYGGEIDLVVGVDTEGAVAGVTVNSHSETPGLGAHIKDGSFLEQFTGHTADIEVVKNNAAAGNDINAITGATISSKAVTSGVNTAIELVVAMQ